MADRLLTLLEPTVRGLGYELLGIERIRSRGAQLLRLYIDQSSGISADDCERVSRQVSDLMEVERAIRGEYTLEVSSPGIDRPLFTLEQHRRFVGQRIAVRLRSLYEGRRRLQGILVEIDDDHLVVDLGGEIFPVPFREVERSRLATDWSAQDVAAKKDR